LASKHRFKILSGNYKNAKKTGIEVTTDRQESAGEACSQRAAKGVAEAAPKARLPWGDDQRLGRAAKGCVDLSRVVLSRAQEIQRAQPAKYDS
jgi:hypothetical protein